MKKPQTLGHKGVTKPRDMHEVPRQGAGGYSKKGYPQLKAVGSLLHVMHQSLLPALTELLGATPHTPQIPTVLQKQIPNCAEFTCIS